MPTFNRLGGPGIINGQSTMNGLDHAMTSVLQSISDVYSELKATLTKISAEQSHLKAAVVRIRAEQAKQMQALFAIEQSVEIRLGIEMLETSSEIDRLREERTTARDRGCGRYRGSCRGRRVHTSAA